MDAVREAEEGEHGRRPEAGHISQEEEHIGGWLWLRRKVIEDSRRGPLFLFCLLFIAANNHCFERPCK
jgi:hypothetical protein